METRLDEITVKANRVIQIRINDSDTWAQIHADEVKGLIKALRKATKTSELIVRGKAVADSAKMIVTAMGTLMVDIPEPKTGPKGGSGASDAIWVEDPSAISKPTKFTKKN